jgi:HupE/UreJ protein
MRVVALLALLLAPLPARAHELGTIQVAATFRQGGTWQVDVAIDEEHIPRLPPRATTRPAGETRFGPIAGLTPELRSRLGVFLSVLVDRSALSFDGRPVTPERLSVDLPPPPADDPFAPRPKVTLHLQGATPPGARTVSFATAVPLGNYPAAFWNEGATEPSRSWQKGGEAGRPFPLSARVIPPPRLLALRHYLAQGFRRVLPQGAETLLFLLGLSLAGRRGQPRGGQVAAFTLACVLALAAALSTRVALPIRLLDPALALSILYVALANLLTREARAYQAVLVSVCGLLHGLALAGALRSPAPPPALRGTAVLGFTLGVAAAELSVIAACLLLIGLPYRGQPWYRHRVVVPASLALATLGLYWSIGRVLQP